MRGTSAVDGGDGGVDDGEGAMLDVGDGGSARRA